MLPTHAYPQRGRRRLRHADAGDDLTDRSHRIRDPLQSSDEYLEAELEAFFRTALGERAGQGNGVGKHRRCFVVFSVVLWIATALSSYKPWGKTPWLR